MLSEGDDVLEQVTAKSILSAGYAKNNSWFGCNYNMNLYRGCCHGCIYCDSRSDCYHIGQFDTVRAKADALQILARELKAKRRPGVVGMGSMSDPYNPFEKTYEFTRGALLLIRDNSFGAAVATKSPLVVRDKDLFLEIKKAAPVLIKVTVTTASDGLCQKIEPHAPLSSERFAAIKELASQGIFTGILLMPVLPFLEDTKENIGEIIRMSKESGARFIYAQFGVTLRSNQKDWFYQKLDEQFPGLREQYIKTYGNAYECISPHAKELLAFFREECKRAGLLTRMEDIVRAYKEPYESRQLTLF